MIGNNRLAVAVLDIKVDMTMPTAAEAAYTTGRLGFLDLLDAQRVTFQSRLALQRLRADRWIAATDLEKSLGRPFPQKDDER